MNAPSALKDDDTGELVSMSRVLSPGERWYWIIDQLSTLNICAHVRIKGELSARELRSALGALQDRHPQLRTAIAQTTPGQAGDGPRFVPADRPIPLREVRLTSPDDKRWVSEVDGHELTEPLDWRSGPLAAPSSSAGRSRPTTSSSPSRTASRTAPPRSPCCAGGSGSPPRRRPPAGPPPRPGPHPSRSRPSSRSAFGSEPPRCPRHRRPTRRTPRRPRRS